MKLLTWFCAFVLWTSGLASAQQGTSPSSSENTAALEQKIRDLEDRLIALEGQVRTLKAQAAPAPSPASPGAPATEAANATAAENVTAQAPTSLGGAGGSAAKALNPDISMIGEFVGVAGGNSIRPSPS